MPCAAAAAGRVCDRIRAIHRVLAVIGSMLRLRVGLCNGAGWGISSHPGCGVRNKGCSIHELHLSQKQKMWDPGGPVNINKAEQSSSANGAVSALERLPHITKRVCLLWGHPEFDAFTSHLLMDSRDGKRQGLPWEVAEELLFLAELRVVKRAIVAAGVTGQPFWEVFNQMMANAEAAAQKAQHEA